MEKITAKLSVLLCMVISVLSIVSCGMAGKNLPDSTDTKAKHSFSASVKDVGITVSCNEDGVIPDNTKVETSEIETSVLEYSDYIVKTSQALSGKSIKGARFFDITLKDADGHEIQPNGDVNVSIACDLPEGIAADENTKISIVHFADNGEASVVAENAVYDAEHRSVTFTAKSFSVYGVIYTVDFKADLGGTVYNHSIEGGTSTTLSGLLTNLGVFDADEAEDYVKTQVADVEFTDSDLVSVSRKDEDWELKSLKPFDTEETMTLTLKDGQKMTLRVTDAQGVSSNLADFLDMFTIQDIAPNESGAYEIVPGVNYTMMLRFREKTPDLQFANGSAMTYTFPDKLSFGDQPISGNFNIKIDDSHIVEGNTYSVEEGVLTVHFNTESPNYDALTASAFAGFSLYFNGEFTDDNLPYTIEFSNNVEKTFIRDTTSGVTVKKSCTLDTFAKCINYTVTVSSTGTNEDVVVKDVLTSNDNAVAIVQDSIAAVSNTGNPVTLNGTASSSGFTYTIPRMENGETITISYKGNIHTENITQNGDGQWFLDERNDVTINETEGSDYTENHFNISPRIDKSVQTSETVHPTDPDNKIIEDYRISVNENKLVTAGGLTIVDALGPDAESLSRMRYFGDGITVTKISDTGIQTDDYRWQDLDEKTDTGWKFTIPETSEPCRYYISYQVEIDTRNIENTISMWNTASIDGYPDDFDAKEHVELSPPVTEINSEKRCTNIDYDTHRITWEITADIPAAGLNSLEVEDTFPSEMMLNSTYQYIKEVHELVNFSVDGIKDKEVYYLSYYYGSSYHDDLSDLGNQTLDGIKFTFTKDNGASTGLYPSNTARKIIITIETECPQEWVTASTLPGRSYLQAQENRASVKANGDTPVPLQATAWLIPPSITKTGSYEGMLNDLPVWKYEVTINGVMSGDNEITDTFRTQYLKIVDSSSYPDANTVKAANEFGPVNYGTTADNGSEVTWADSATGAVFHTSDETIPKNANTGELYPSYLITYYLTPINKAAWRKMQQEAADNGGQYQEENTAAWNGKTKEATVDVSYKGIAKEVLTDEADLSKTDEDVWIDYKVTINPEALILNDGSDLNIIDTYDGIVPESINVEPSAGVTYDMSNSSINFTVPDATKTVITYRARAVFSELPIGQTAETETENSVSIDGTTYNDVARRTARRFTSGMGEAPNASFKVLKYEAGDMAHVLPGVTFALLDENKDPVRDGSQRPVTAITLGNGIAEFKGHQDNLGWVIVPGTKYYIREVNAPSGYLPLGRDIEFTVSSDGTTDFENYVFPDGHTEFVKNYPAAKVTVTKEWEDEGDHSNDYITVQLQQKPGDAEWTNTICMINAQGEWIDQTMTESAEQVSDWTAVFDHLPLEIPAELPAGSETEMLPVQYRVIETEINGSPVDTSLVEYERSKTGNHYTEMIINKKPLTGSLKIRKEVTVDGEATTEDLVDGTYTFAVTNNDDYDANVEITIIGGYPREATINGSLADIDGSGCVEITGLTPGLYTVTESVPTNPNITVVGDNPKQITVTGGKTGDEAPVVTFVNNYNSPTSSLTISKVLDSQNPDDMGREFHFRIEAGSQDINGIYGDLDFDYGIATADLKDGQSVTATGLPVGMTFRITEETVDPSEFTVTVTNDATGTSIEGDQGSDSYSIDVQMTEGGQAVTFTNTRKAVTTSHQITARKNLTGGTLAGGDFTFILSESGHELQRKTNSADGSITFDPIVYDENDIGQTFTYKIEEVNDGTSGVRYDESVYYIEVQVTQDPHGAPVASQTRVFKTPTNN